MLIEDTIKNSLRGLTDGGVFHVDSVIYDKENFGNVVVVLRSNKRVDIRLVKDRGSFWCEIGQNGQWYFVEDIFTLMEIEDIRKSSEFGEYIEETASLLRINTDQIIQAFNADNLKDTRSRVKAIANQRVMKMFEDGVKPSN